MARLYQTGFELNSLTTGVEFTTIASTGAAMSGTAARSGAYGLQVSGLTSATAAGVNYKFLIATGTGPYFLRVYLNVQTPPSASNHIISLNSSTATVGASPEAKITLESNGTLILHNAAGTQVGSASVVLSTNTWHMVDLKVDATATNGSRVLEARLNGTVFATSSAQTFSKVFGFSVGGNLDSEAQTTGEWWFDDIALNDDTGSFQTSYPGPGKIIHLKPNATGDANTFATQTGGTAGFVNNYTRVNEVTPDNATTYNGSVILNAEDFFNVEDSGLAPADTVNVVMVGARLRNTVADPITALRLEIKKASGGTIAQSSDIIFNNGAFATNVTGAPHNYALTTYQDPDGANWTQSTLDSMQIGYKLTTAGTNRFDISTEWATVDYTQTSATSLAWFVMS
jgi:hypothetical protein